MLGMPTSETFYGDAVNAQKAPEIINGIMSSLPPEQMYDLMKQMKECIHVIKYYILKIVAFSKLNIAISLFQSF